MRLSNGANTATGVAVLGGIILLAVLVVVAGLEIALPRG